MASSSGNDDDLTIPRAAINKMIKETLPNVRVANDARELVVNCCTEFIHLISSEANEICNKSEKKTISPEHVIQGKWYVWGFCLSEGRGQPASCGTHSRQSLHSSPLHKYWQTKKPRGHGSSRCLEKLLGSILVVVLFIQRIHVRMASV